MTWEEAVKRANPLTPEKILASIPEKKVTFITSEICRILAGNGLSVYQAEMLLDITKDRLKRTLVQ